MHSLIVWFGCWKIKVNLNAQYIFSGNFLEFTQSKGDHSYKIVRCFGREILNNKTNKNARNVKYN